MTRGESGSTVPLASTKLQREGEALRARPQAEVIASLASVLDAWSDPNGRWQNELAPRLAENSGFSEATVRSGMRGALQRWNGEALHRVVADELGGGDVTGYPQASVLLAGCIPMPTLLQTLLVLAVRSPVLLKMASRDRVTARLVRDSIDAVDPQLARCVEVLEPDALETTSTRARFFASGCVIASGSDETIEAIRPELRPEQHLVSYGHRLSIAVLGESALDPATAAALSTDVAAWDQLGCLSPAMAFIVGGSSGKVGAFAESLAAELEQLERDTPRGTIDAQSAAAIRTERETARMRFASHSGDSDGPEPRVFASGGTEWTVVLEGREPRTRLGDEPGPELRAAPLHRFLRLHPVPDFASLREICAPLQPWISTIASAGLGAGDVASLPELGGNRVCAVGQMQTPELGWHRDGLALLRPLIP